MKLKKSKFNGDFSLKKTLNSDQCPSDEWFYENGKYSTILELEGNWIKLGIKEGKDKLTIHSNIKLTKNQKQAVIKSLLYHFWSEYPLKNFYSEFERDKYIGKTIDNLKGLRVMRDLNSEWRILQAICTQNTSISHINLMENNLRKVYGKKVKLGNGNSFYTFPITEKVSKASVRDLKNKCRLGYRAEYLKTLAKSLYLGKLEIDKIREMEISKARDELMKIKGIGPKVADIILLYGFGKRKAFPMDVWIKKGLTREYFNGKNTSDKKLREFASKKFGEHAGIAHLYIFSYERMKAGKIEKRKLVR